MTNRWGDKRYNSLNFFLREKFGEKVIKISLDGGFTCPNRDGLISNKGCIFCSGRGSGEYAGDRNKSIGEQFKLGKESMKKKWASGKYIAYFQAFTNTYGSIEVLRSKYEEALKEEGVVGLAIATRPDCLSDEVINLLEEMSKKAYLWVELGLQTKSDETAKLINRGYPLTVFEEGVQKLKNKNIDTVVHTIFGLPGEDEEQMLNTISYLSKIGIQGIKFHLLYLVKGTGLEELYREGKLSFLERDQYVNLIVKAIALLPPDIVIHRLTGDPPSKLLIEPVWSTHKWEILNQIQNKLETEDIYQGLYNYTK
ncbi:MAG TPA: TIGR01212 family radical SAM protein [Clostridiaceae bacterium]